MHQKVFVLKMAIWGTKNVIPEGIETDTIIIGWSKAPELLTLRDHEAQRSVIQAAYDRDAATAGKQAKDVDRFLHQMRPGDLVLVSELGGVHFFAACVVGDAEYRSEYKDDETAYRRRVVWLNAKKPFNRTEASLAMQEELSGRGWTCKEAISLENEHLEFLSDDDRAILEQARHNRGLALHQDYIREEVHDIFSPDTAFTPGAGLWGMKGPIPIKGRDGDFVFFVSFGRRQGDHLYEDGITEDGIVIWESMAKQRLEDPQVRQWIEHDETKNAIYLFLRTKKKRAYTYLGRLKYLSHDNERQEPVHFQWQLCDGSVPIDVVKSMDLELLPPTSKPVAVLPPSKHHGLKQHPPPSPVAKGVPTTDFKARKGIDYSEQDAKNRKNGAAGELLVYEHEKEQLMSHGHPNLATKVRHIAREQGDGAGYDILSYDIKGREKFIEVKTTIGSKSTPFFISRREVAFSELKADQFVLCRLYDYNPKTDTASFYELPGAVSVTCVLEPTQFRAKPGKV